MAARNLPIIAYRTRVRVSSYDHYLISTFSWWYVLKGQGNLHPLPTNQRPRKRMITLLVLDSNTLRGPNIVFVPVLSCAHCCT